VYWIKLAQDKVQWWALVNNDNELLGSIKSEKFLDELSNCHLKNDLALWD
jgi:hypothetical protein